MNDPHVVTGALDDGTLATLDRRVERFGRNHDHLFTTAVPRFVSEQGHVFLGGFSSSPGYPDLS